MHVHDELYGYSYVHVPSSSQWKGNVCIRKVQSSGLVADEVIVTHFHGE